MVGDTRLGRGKVGVQGEGCLWEDFDRILYNGRRDVKHKVSRDLDITLMPLFVLYLSFRFFFLVCVLSDF